MATRPSTIEFEHVGIGTALSRNRLSVPPNQREYSWEEEHVQDLFHDLAGAIDSNKPSYFLGTIVLTRGPGGTFEVADGQQRLATTTIFWRQSVTIFKTVTTISLSNHLTISYAPLSGRHVRLSQDFV